MKYNYKAMVLSCIDPRFQPIVYNFLKKKKLTGKYSSFTIAGSAIGVTAGKFKKWHKPFWDNFDTSIKLHNIKKLIAKQQPRDHRLSRKIKNSLIPKLILQMNQTSTEQTY